MLTQDQAQKFAASYLTSTDNILKEHYQMYILDILYKSLLGKNLVFKGGTALRLAYGSFRFSEDLDFSLLKNISYTSFKTAIGKIPKSIPEATVKEISDKYHTFFGRIVISTGFKPIPVGIKVEINKNSKNFASSIALLKSPFNNLEVSCNVYTLESIFADKLDIITTGSRREPRDLFDAWYISQKLNTHFDIANNFKYSSKELMDKLNPFIPKNHNQVLTTFSI